ncbi:DUF5686 and carboxypeptidase regulatory-like domain-containing protein [Flavobacterium sp. DG1-102-2]|uniref:DUF5686 and carboxypeptidase regulatory-like domain-containing protein n=1 Tax=Flavobacterium sp. DG1-102-2 TaxID=3081663 RepID=UPI00294A8F3A|nr:DUF5686 and carboxypeptidase regulatory-like domain-containing protein [Flavobacterium sp. DG1-102-2]MDV6167947.1 DUF5686 and carboxypeptidase regulatory-like domain-containing protein [Flavobacterium sp. DG1-102-2]
MKKAIILFFLIAGLPLLAQVKGRITSKKGEPIPFVSIVVADTYNGTSSNEDGSYTLNIKEKGQYTLIFQSIGYKTRNVVTDIASLPHTLNVTLEEEQFNLNEVVVSSKDNPADDVIKKAIENRSANAQRITSFDADYYSRGVFRLKNVPKKILGQNIGDLGSSLDGSGNGILYLSETVSRVKYQSPDHITERVIASKVSGDDAGFSFNNASAADFDFYDNYIPFERNAVSPIADNAFGYYDYNLESSFYTNDKQLVNKIRVTPKRENSPTFNGYIYILENTWQLYAVDLTIKGSQMEQELINSLNIKQNYGYNAKAQVWTKNTQVLNFEAGLFGLSSSGTFSSVYSNFSINPEFKPKTFTAEIQSFEDGANKKPDSYWRSARPIPLTPEEAGDYRRKDSLQEISSTPAAIKASDKERNKFKWTSIPVGYAYHNSEENWDISYTGIIRRLAFNSVQAYHLSPGFYFTQYNADRTAYTTFGTDLSYGFAEKRFRITGTIAHKFNNFSRRIVTLNGGTAIEQYNPEKPINKIVNSISTLFFRDNYMKLYDNQFVRLSYEEEIVNGIQLNGSIEYTRKRSLFNNTNFSTLKDAYKPYTSNNPLLLYDPATEADNITHAFEKHNMFRASIGTRISFGQKYITRPDGKENIANGKYPRLFLKYEKGFASSISDYNFDHISAKVNYDLTLGNAGELGLSFRGGKFFNSDNIAFTDYKHFNGNQTHIGKSERYLNVFNFLPYYSHSTNDSYLEVHAEHNFKGFITNAIPLMNKLNYYLVAGYHALAIPDRDPYMEFTVGLDNVGWGKARFLRIDYIRSYNGSGFISDGVIFGLTFLDILE